jgi:undecaprenyl-diphosphatase
MGWNVNTFDFRIISFLNRFAGYSRIFDSFMVTLSNTELLKGGAIVAALLWIWFHTDERKDHNRELVILTLIVSPGSVLLARGLALSLPFRERPLLAPSIHFRTPYTMNPHALESWSSFPSDHAAFFFCAATCIFFASRWLGILAFLQSVFVVCLPRIYLGIHYPTDILAGALLGTGMAFGVKAPRVGKAIAGCFLRWEQLHPREFYPVFFMVIFEVSELFASVRLIGHFGFLVIKDAAHHVFH